MSQVQSKKRLSGRWSRAVLMSLLAVGAHDFFAASQAYARGATRTSINHNTNVNRNTNVNVNRNTNVNVNRNVDVDVNRRGGYHPVATGVAVGAAVAVTAAVVGSMVTTLPPSCVPYVHAGITYQQCGGAYYQPQYAGSSVTYVVVDPPR
ncbi:MAG: hypothetical protein JNM54_11540 [Candidatus Accumulibacter sp.]|nr:hypothetical protein [Candidatus Accumulibacter sp. ACC005]MBL8368529.1 hypothetical protein [Accumulibacter sp.]